MQQKKLKILFLTSWYPTNIIPNNGNFVKKHAEAIATKHQVSVFFVITSPEVKKIQKECFVENSVDATLYYLPTYRLKFLKFYHFFKIYLKEIWNQKNLDLIHVNVLNPIGIFALLFKFLKRIPYLISEHDSGYFEGLSKKKKIPIHFLNQLIVRNATKVCPVSELLKKAMIDQGLRGSYEVVGNTIDTSIFKPTQQANSEVFTMCHVSNFSEAKNIDGVLRVFKKIVNQNSNCKLRIAGDGNLAQLKKQVESMRIPCNNIELIGACSPLKIASLLQTSNLYLSFSNYETFGITIVEAIACGIRVVATNTGVVNEFKHNKFLKIIPVGDELLLEQSIVKAMVDQQNFDKIKMHQFVQNKFGKETIANKFSDIYWESLRS